MARVNVKSINMKQFVRERDAALLSLDRKKIEAYAKKYDVPLPKDETVFWAGIHKCIISINSATLEQKQKSHDWLVEHGFKPYIS